MVKIISAVALLATLSLSAQAKVCKPEDAQKLSAEQVAFLSDYKDFTVERSEKLDDKDQPVRMALELTEENLETASKTIIEYVEVPADVAVGIYDVAADSFAEAKDSGFSNDTIAAVSVDPAGKLVIGALDITDGVIVVTLRTIQDIPANSLYAVADGMKTVPVVKYAAIVPKLAGDVVEIGGDYVVNVVSTTLNEAKDPVCEFSAIFSNLIRFEAKKSAASLGMFVYELVEWPVKIVGAIVLPPLKSIYRGLKWIKNNHEPITPDKRKNGRCGKYKQC